MKRSEALAPLSREHLSALILVYCLKHGHSPNPRYPWPSDPILQREKVLQMWQNELHWHFEAEERYLLDPFANVISPPLQKVSLQLRHEHEHMRKLMRDLSLLMSEEITQAICQILQELCQMLEAHVKKEEHIYFVRLERELSAQQLAQAAQAILDYYSQREPFVCVFTGENRHPVTNLRLRKDK